MIVLSLIFLLIFEPIISRARPQGCNYCIPCPVLDPCSYCPYPSCQSAPQAANGGYPSCQPAPQAAIGGFSSHLPVPQAGNLGYPSGPQPLNLCVVYPESPRPEPLQPDPLKSAPPKSDPSNPDPPKPDPPKPDPPKPDPSKPSRRSGADLFSSMLSMPAVFADAMMTVQ